MMKVKQEIKITQSQCTPHHGTLRFGVHRARCALGARGVTPDKIEGDKASPEGHFFLRRLWYRPDRIQRPQTLFPMAQIWPKSGWCDAPHQTRYNRPISRPFKASHEVLWRRDNLYDVFFELSHNDDPPVAGKGSAVFLHLHKNNFQPTLGCVAVDFKTMQFIVRYARPGCRINIAAK